MGPVVALGPLLGPLFGRLRAFSAILWRGRGGTLKRGSCFVTADSFNEKQIDSAVGYDGWTLHKFDWSKRIEAETNALP